MKTVALHTRIVDSLRTYWQALAPERVFALVAITFGLLFVVVTPPMQVPDENLHFLRAYQISEFQMLPTKVEGGYGGQLPKTVVDMADHWIEKLPFRPGNKEYTFEYKQEIVHGFQKPLAPGSTERAVFTASGAYAPTVYAPQAAAMFVGRLFHLPAFVLFYLGRLANLAVWIALAYWAIRLIPVGKWLFAGLLLMPMTLFQAASQSADAVTNGAVFLFVAVVVRAIMSRESITRGELALIGATGTLVALSKIVFVILVPLVLLIPRRRFSSLRSYAAWLIAVAAVPVAAAGVWALESSHVSSAIAVANRSRGVHGGAQVHAILAAPALYGVTLLNSFLSDSSDIIFSGVLGLLGWVDTQLPMWLLGSQLAILVLLAASVQISKTQRFNRLARAGFALTAVFLILAISSAIYVSYTPFGGAKLYGFQGRYLIPVLAVLAPLCFARSPLALVSQNVKKGLVVFGSSAVLLTTVYIVVDRYVAFH